MASLLSVILILAARLAIKECDAAFLNYGD